MSDSAQAGPTAGGSSRIDELVRNNQRFAAGAYPGSQHGTPTLGVAVVTCMDAHTDAVRGFVYEVHSGQLREVQ